MASRFETSGSDEPDPSTTDDSADTASDLPHTDESNDPAQRRWRRPLIIVGAIVTVLATAIAGFLIYRNANPPAWVADDGYDFDVCSLIESEELMPLFKALHPVAVDPHHQEAVGYVLERDDLQPVRHHLSQRELSVDDPQRTTDACDLGFPYLHPGADNTSSMALNALTVEVGPRARDLDEIAAQLESSRNITPAEELSDFGDHIDEAWYFPAGTPLARRTSGMVLVQHDDTEIILTAPEYSPNNRRNGETDPDIRDELITLTQRVLERLPHSFVMPGTTAQKPCTELDHEPITALLNETPTYSRSNITRHSPGLYHRMLPTVDEPPELTGNPSISYCNYATDSRHLEIRIHTHVRELDDYLRTMTETEFTRDIRTINPDNDVELFYTGNFTHAVRDLDTNQLIRVTIEPEKYEPASDSDRDPPYTTDELDHIAEIAQNATGTTP